MENKLEILINKACISELRLVFEQAEVRNNRLLSNADDYYSKSFNIVTVLLTTGTGVIAYIIGNPNWTDILNIVSYVFLVLVVCVIIILWKNINLQNYVGAGADPVSFNNAEYFRLTDDEKEKGNTPELFILQRLVVDLHERMKENDKLNIDRAKRINLAMNWLASIPIVCVLLYLLLFLACK